MGPDSNSGTVVAYLDGKPVEIGHPMPEITPDYSAGGVTAEEAAAAAERLAEIWGDMSVTVEVAAEKAFHPVGEEAFDRAKRLMGQCERVLCPVTAFGPINERNRLLREQAQQEGKLVQ